MNDSIELKSLRPTMAALRPPPDRDHRTRVGPVKRIWPFLVPGVVLSGVGLVWTLQGLDVLRGSVMSGSSLWATIGPIVLLVGLVLIGIAIGTARRHRTR